MNFPYIERNASRQGNLSSGGVLSDFGAFKALETHTTKKPCFWGSLPCFSLFDNIISIFFIDKPRTESRRPAFGILSRLDGLKDFHTITRRKRN
jgi:hypothetical protein